MSRVIVELPSLFLDNEETEDGFQLADVEGWWDTVTPRDESEARERGHGDFGQDEIFQDARHVTITGMYQSYADPSLLFSARDQLAALHGQIDMPLVVTDEKGTWRSAVKLVSKIAWDVDYAPGCASFEFTVKADDPRKYGPLITQTVGVPSPGVGMSDPFTDPIDEGDPGNLGRIICTNTGGAPTSPKVTIYGGVGEGFELLCMEHARVVRVTRPIPAGSHVTVDMGSGEVWIDDQSILPASYVPVSEWFEIGAGETCTIQWTPLGTITGSPHMDIEHAEASW